VDNLSDVLLRERAMSYLTLLFEVWHTIAQTNDRKSFLLESSFVWQPVVSLLKTLQAHHASAAPLFHDFLDWISATTTQSISQFCPLLPLELVDELEECPTNVCPDFDFSHIHPDIVSFFRIRCLGFPFRLPYPPFDLFKELKIRLSDSTAADWMERARKVYHLVFQQPQYEPAELTLSSLLEAFEQPDSVHEDLKEGTIGSSITACVKGLEKKIKVWTEAQVIFFVTICILSLLLDCRFFSEK
jgi:hypothetical protein